MITNILQSFQLNEKEKQIFLKVLELGSQPASQVAKVCELPRNTVRSILDGLVKKNLMVKSNRANTQYYTTESSKNLIVALKHRKLKLEHELEDQIHMLQEYGDELESHTKAKSRPKITFYEGWAGLERVYEDTLTATRLKSWAPYDALHGYMPDYFKTYFSRRAAKGIPMRSIHPDTEAGRAGQKNDAQELRESALVPAEKFTWVPEIQIYDEKVNITSFSEKLGVLIQSKEIAEALEAIFDLSYEAAVKYGKTTKLPEEERKKFEE